MSVWSQLGLQEGVSFLMQSMIFFHDYMMVLLVIIMVFVSYIFSMIILYSGLDKYLVDSHLLELIWTVVPMIFLLFMAFPSLYLLYMTEDINNPSVTLKVIGHQWYWEYEYLFTGSSLSFNSYMVSDSYRNLDVDNRLALPAQSNSLGLVTSKDVLHSWTIPSLGVKADATPGRLNFVNLSPNTTGVYYGQCSELCGSNHSFMPIGLEVISIKSFLGGFIPSLI